MNLRFLELGSVSAKLAPVRHQGKADSDEKGVPFTARYINHFVGELGPVSPKERRVVTLLLQS